MQKPSHRHARTIAHMNKRGAALVAFVVLGIAAAQTTRLRISVNLAQIDAKVTDSKGNPVPGLTADDFELQIDGKAQKITHCDYIPGVAPKAPDPDRKASPSVTKQPGVGSITAVRPEDIRRTMVIFVDDLSNSAERI